MKQEVEGCGGALGETEYAAEVTVHALLPEGRVEEFCRRITELTSGTVEAALLGETFRAVPR